MPSSSLARTSRVIIASHNIAGHNMGQEIMDFQDFVEQLREDGGAVEAGNAQPVDGATGGDQRRGSTVGAVR